MLEPPVLPEKELAIKGNHVYEITLSKKDYEDLGILLSAVSRIVERTYDDGRGMVNLCFLYSEHDLYIGLFHQIRSKHYMCWRNTVS